MAGEHLDGGGATPPDVDLGKQLSESVGNLQDHILSQLRAVLDQARAMMACSECGLLVPTDDENSLRFLVSANSREGISEVVESLLIPLETSLAGYVFSTCQPISVSNPEDFYPVVDEKTGLETKYYLAAPIIDGENVIGVLTCVNRPADQPQQPFDAEEIVRSGQIARVLACGIRFYRRFLLNLGLMSDDLKYNTGMVAGTFEMSLDSEPRQASSALARAVNDLEQLSEVGQAMAAELIGVIARHDVAAEENGSNEDYGIEY